MSLNEDALEKNEQRLHEIFSRIGLETRKTNNRKGILNALRVEIIRLGGSSVEDKVFAKRASEEVHSVLKEKGILASGDDADSFAHTAKDKSH